MMRNREWSGSRQRNSSKGFDKLEQRSDVFIGPRFSVKPNYVSLYSVKLVGCYVAVQYHHLLVVRQRTSFRGKIARYY